MGAPPTSTAGFGIFDVTSDIRVPNPPAKITACLHFNIDQSTFFLGFRIDNTIANNVIIISIWLPFFIEIIRPFRAFSKTVITMNIDETFFEIKKFWRAF